MTTTTPPSDVMIETLTMLIAVGGCIRDDRPHPIIDAMMDRGLTVRGGGTTPCAQITTDGINVVAWWADSVDMVEAVWVEAHEEHKKRYPTPRDAHHRIHGGQGGRSVEIDNLKGSVLLTIYKEDEPIATLIATPEVATEVLGALSDVILAAKTHEDRS